MTPEFPDGYAGPSLDDLASVVQSGGDERLAVTAPFTGETVGHVPACTPADVRQAVHRAREAQADWADRPVADRAEIVERFASLVHDRRDDLLDLIQLESGKARYDAAEEILDVRMTAGHYADRAESYLAPERHRGPVPWLTRAREYRDPVGVAGFITPWNYPLTLAVSDALPALLAGNAAVIKAAEETPHTALLAVELLRDAGVPADCVQVVTGHGETTGPPLIESVDFVSFTGSTAVGREVAAQAGEQLLPMSLELGGKGPMIVRADAPIRRTVTGAVRGGFASAGQLCIATERVYVHESRFEEFRDRLVERVRGLTLGASFDYRPDVGSMVSDRQLETVAEQVEDAVDAGATLLTGGRRRPDIGPRFYEPTVLTHVPPDTSLACQETFGPVLAVTPVADDEEAIRRANDSPYGLHGSVWTEDLSAGRRLARQIDCGSVSVNDPYISMWGSTDAPMGGKKDSGIGRRHGDEGFEKYTESQTVTVQRGHPLVPIPGIPKRLTAGALSLYLRIAQEVGWK